MIKLLAMIVVVGVAIADPIPEVLPKARFPEGRIIGGVDTTIDKVPYQVSITVGGQHYCGGSIIAEDLILTAAHCATEEVKYYAVRAGSSYYFNGGSIHRVSKIIIHEEYYLDEMNTPSNDIALFRLSSPLEFNLNRQPIKLYEPNEETRVGKYGTITGWGTVVSGSDRPPMILQTVSIPIISKDQCREAYRLFTTLKPGQICAAYPNGGRDSCQGDSGGPLVVDGRLAGVVSWGLGCAVRGQPGVYTEVAHFHKWIMKNSSGVLTSMLSLGTLALTTIGFMVLTN